MMDSQEFRQRSREVIEFIINYHEIISQNRIMHDKRDGYLQSVLPDSAPENPESFESILEDIKNYIIPSIVHWRHPRYFAYFPCGGSYPSILADMLISTINCASFSWASGPTCTELEILSINWLGRMIGLPESFFSESGENGGGVFQVSATDAMLVTIIAARHAKNKDLNRQNLSVDLEANLQIFMAYCSTISHASIVKVSEVALVQVRLLETDEKRRLRGQTVERAMKEDREKGFIPFFLFASLGTTACCSCDVIEEIGPVCKKYGVWMHVDGSYAGSALVCPEFRYFLNGIEYADSFSIDPSMWMLMNFDCCALWVQNRDKLIAAIITDPLYLHHAFSDNAIDYQYWGTPLGRRFRALKLWFVIKCYGLEGLQNYIRCHIHLAQIFEKFIRKDGRFVIENDVTFGLVCFRLKGCNALNVRLLSNINKSGKIFLVGTMLERNYVIRLCICSENVTEKDVIFAWKIVRDETDKLLNHGKFKLDEERLPDSPRKGS